MTEGMVKVLDWQSAVDSCLSKYRVLLLDVRAGRTLWGAAYGLKHFCSFCRVVRDEHGIVNCGICPLGDMAVASPCGAAGCETGSLFLLRRTLRSELASADEVYLAAKGRYEDLVDHLRLKGFEVGDNNGKGQSWTRR